MFRWLGWELVLPSDLASLPSLMFDLGRRKKERLGYILIWQFVIWSMWRSWNARIFSRKEMYVLQLVDMVKFTYWKWILEKHYSHVTSVPSMNGIMNPLYVGTVSVLWQICLGVGWLRGSAHGLSHVRLSLGVPVGSHVFLLWF